MTDEEDMTAQLLRLAGAPPDPRREQASRVRDAVYREWRAARRRQLRRRGVAAGIVLSAAAAAVLAILILERPRPVVVDMHQRIATAQLIQGHPRLLHGGSTGVGMQLDATMIVYPNDLVETDTSSRVALRAEDGSSMRIDQSSRVRLLGPASIEVITGAAYLATSDGSRGFEVRTAKGAIRDIGTQFEVRVTGGVVRVRVRTGMVEVRRGESLTTAAAGTEATVTSAGVEVRRMPSYGSDWAWTASVAPPFRIEGQPLRAFLEHVRDEHGWTIVYADRGVEDSANRILLRGSVDGLSAEDAVRVVLATSGLRYRLSAGELFISRAGATR